MFQGLRKGFDSFLEGKIAEEQAKQASSSASQSRPSSSSAGRRAPSSSRRPGTRTDSPSKRPSSRLRNADSSSAPPKGADPDDFVIGDDASDISRVNTPLPVKEGQDGPILEEKTEGEEGKKEQDAATLGGEKRTEKVVESTTITEPELPDDVRKRLAKLETLTSKYQDLLRNYRTAHARVAAIEPFESTLREHTPLTSIGDPGALVEFLNQRSLQSDMVMKELTRVTTENREIVKERDELKVRLEDAEKKAKEAFDEAAGLREQRKDEVEKDTTDEKKADANKEPKDVKEADDDDDFFSYDNEKPRFEAEAELRAEMSQQQEYINELSTENATLRSDLETTKLDLSAMENKVTTKEREITSLQQDLTTTKTELETATTARNSDREQEEAASASLVESEARILDLQDQLQKYQESLAQKNTELKEQTAASQEKMKQINKSVIESLKQDRKKADEAKELAEGQLRDAKLSLNMFKSEAEAAGEVINRLRGHEGAAATWKRKVEEAEAARAAAEQVAESKKGHEAAATSLRAQLKNAIRDRDAAYQMIVDCSRCTLPEDTEASRTLDVPTPDGSRPSTQSRNSSEATEQTEVSTQPTEVSESPAATEAAKPVETKSAKKKRKAKAKKASHEASSASADLPTFENQASDAPRIDGPSSQIAAAAPSIDELRRNPEKAKEIFSRPLDNSTLREMLTNFVGSVTQDHDREAEEHDSLLRHHESVIEQRDQSIEEYVRLVREKDEEIEAVRRKIGFQEEAIEGLNRRLREQEGLEEELETLRESLAEVGGQTTGSLQQASEAREEAEKAREEKGRLQVELEELQVEDGKRRREMRELRAELEEQKKSSTANEEVEALKEKVQASEKTREALQVAKTACEKQIEDLKAQQSANGAESDAKHQSLSKDFDELRVKASGLETDLAAANELAQERFKALTDLREHVNGNLQPELKRLRVEAEELKGFRTEVEKKNKEVGRLESVERGLRSEISTLKTDIERKEKEITSLRDKFKASEAKAEALQDSLQQVRNDLETSGRTRDDAVEAREKLSADLKKAQDEVKTARARIEQLEPQISSFRDAARTAQESLDIKSAQHASAQSLMSSLQDQTRELAAQMKEVSQRNDALEEELEDTRRLLHERGNEGQTMRRLLSEAEGRAESRVKGLREQLDLAVEERNRAEEDAAVAGRRKARELEDLRGRVRESEAALTRAKEAREEAETREKGYKSRLDEIEQSARQAQEEVSEVRSAMASLRDSLDESERQAGALEKEKAELRSLLDERDTRLEKLQKSGKNMAEEIRALKAANNKSAGQSIQSSRSSIESSSRVMSPVGRGSNGTPIGGHGPVNGAVDTAYLKNVLLQFMEQKEKRYQRALVPVLGQLLGFDKVDEGKWEAAIAAR